MPRVYSRKRILAYSQAELENAVKMVKRGELSAKLASSQFRIPLSTIYTYLSCDKEFTRPGGKTILSLEEENFLICVLNKYQDWQQPLTRSQFIPIARTFMIEMKKKGVHENSSLKEWFYGFQRRWKDEIKLVEAYQLEQVRSNGCTQEFLGKNNQFSIQNLLLAV